MKYEIKKLATCEIEMQRYEAEIQRLELFAKNLLVWGAHKKSASVGAELKKLKALKPQVDAEKARMAIESVVAGLDVLRGHSSRLDAAIALCKDLSDPKNK